jgi:hypothetical protein
MTSSQPAWSSRSSSLRKGTFPVLRVRAGRALEAARGIEPLYAALQAAT